MANTTCQCVPEALVQQLTELLATIQTQLAECSCTDCCCDNEKCS